MNNKDIRIITSAINNKKYDTAEKEIKLLISQEPKNLSYKNLYELSEKVRCELLGSKILKGVGVNLKENYINLMINPVGCINNINSKDVISKMNFILNQ